MIGEQKEYILKNGLKVQIKTPETEDAFGLISHLVSVADSTDFLLSEPEDYKAYVDDIEKEKEYIRRAREGRDYLFAVYLDGKIVGNSTLSFHTHVKDRHRARVGIAIQKDYWGIGIGTALFKEMIAAARKTEGIEQIELGVISTNERAKKLYEKMGFVKVATVPRYLKLKDNSYLDEDTMILFL